MDRFSISRLFLGAGGDEQQQQQQRQQQQQVAAAFAELLKKLAAAPDNQQSIVTPEPRSTGVKRRRHGKEADEDEELEDGSSPSSDEPSTSSSSKESTPRKRVYATSTPTTATTLADEDGEDGGVKGGAAASLSPDSAGPFSSQQWYSAVNYIALASQQLQQQSVDGNGLIDSHLGWLYPYVAKQQQQQQQVGAAPTSSHKRKGGQIRFTNDQTDALELKFETQKYLNLQERKKLAKQLALSERQVRTWLQNRRAKWRRVHGGGDDCAIKLMNEGKGITESQDTEKMSAATPGMERRLQTIRPEISQQIDIDELLLGD